MTVFAEPTLFQRHLGDDFAALPAEVQAAHSVTGRSVWAGRAGVTRGASIWARVIAKLFGFPQATDDTPVQVVMTPRGNGEVWDRTFGTYKFRSHLKRRGAVMTERFGPFTFTLDLHVRDAALHFPVVAGRLGPVPLPRFALPVSVAREYAQDGRFHFNVALQAPLTGAPVVHYRGWLQPV